MIALSAVALPIHAGRVVFVDNGHAGGDGTQDRPFGTIAEAQSVSRAGDVIFIAEATVPYEENVVLTKGQMLVGSAYGLDALRVEMKVVVDGPALPAAVGTGPVIHGNITMGGDNIVAGITIHADKKTGAALSAESPQGPLAFRKLFIRTSDDAFGFYVGSSLFPTTWIGGAIEATNRGSGIFVNGGNGNVTFDHVALSGVFASGIEVHGRTGGTVLFHNASAVKLSDVSRSGVVITNSKGTVKFDSPLQITTTGGAGLVVNHASTIAITGGASWIEATNGTALDVRDATIDIVLDRVSATGVVPGRVTDGIVADKVRGRLTITGEGTTAGSGGRIANALSYGLRLTQSAGIHVSNMVIEGGGTVASPEECPADIPKQTNLRCRAGLYLRHIEKSSFENMSIDNNGGVGLNANNLSEVTFADVHVSKTGDQQSEPALLIDEVRGSVTFTRCSFVDGGGGGVLIEQRFNAATITFDRCEIAAPQRPLAAATLVRANLAGSGRLDLQLLNTNLHDNAGSALALNAADTSTALLNIRDSRFDRFGSGAINVAALQSASVTLTINGSHIAAPAVHDALIGLMLAPSSAGCVGIDANELLGGGNPAIRLNGTKLRVAGDPATFAPRNGGASVSIDPSASVATGPCQ